jgi:hypothetical protein
VPLGGAGRFDQAAGFQADQEEFCLDMHLTQYVIEGLLKPAINLLLGTVSVYKLPDNGCRAFEDNRLRFIQVEKGNPAPALRTDFSD